MNEFKQALQDFLTGQTDFAHLQAALDIELASNPADAPRYLEVLRNLYAAGRLPQQLFEVLERQINTVTGAPAAPPAAPPSAPPAVPPADDGKTRFRGTSEPGPAASAPQEEDEDDGRTRLRSTPGPQPTVGPSTTQRTGQTGQTGQTGVTGQTGRTGSVGPTGTTGAGWSHPEQWQGEDQGPVDVGSVLKGRFVMEMVIGHGGMGIVFKAKDLRKEEAQDRNPYIAVKVLNDSFKQHPESLKALQRESRKAQDLAHPNIATVFDFDRDGSNVFMTMEFLEGEPLDKFLKRYRDRGMPFDKGLPLIRDMANGLEYAHQRGIVHSDFKPANAFLTKQGTVKIFDFGIARAAKHSDQAGGEMTLFDAGSLGALTPAYATVSMVEGGDPDIRDDIYALGCVAYEILTGRHPYNKRSALKARNAGMQVEPVPGLNRRQSRMMQKALAYERDEQPDSVAEFMDGLEPRAINKTALVAGVVVTVLLVIILATWVPSYLQERYLEKLTATLESGDSTQIALILSDLEDELTPAEQSIVYRDNSVTSPLLRKYFEDNAFAVTDYRNGRYDFAEANRLQQQMERLFPGSVFAQQLQQDLETRLSEAVVFVNEGFQLALEQNILIPEQGANSALQYREILAQLEPGHDSVTGDSLPLAIARQGRLALQAEELPTARALVSAAMTISADDPELLNLRTAVDSAYEEFELEQRIASLENQLSSLDRTSSLAAFQQATPTIEELLRERPNSAVAQRVVAELEALLSASINGNVANRQFATAREDLQSVVAVVGTAFASQQTGVIDRAETRFNTSIQNALGEIQRLAQSGGFAPPNEAQAAQQIARLQSIGADAATVELAREAVQQGYLDGARSARGANEFERARTLANLGLQSRPNTEMSNFLQQELADIDAAERSLAAAADAAERAQLAAERAQQIRVLVREFEAGIGNPDLTIEDGRRLTNTVSRLQGLGDSGDVVRNGRQRVSDALLQQARTLAANQQWEEARSLVTATRGLLPESREAEAYAAQLENDFRRFQAGREEAALAAAQDQYQQLLRSTRIDRAWLDSVWQARSRVEPDPAFLANSERRISEIITAQIGRLAAGDQLTEARALLNRAQDLFSNDNLLIAAGRNLQSAEASYLERTAEREAQAALQARKQSVRDQIGASNFDTADQQVAALRRDLPANDAFLKNEVPRLYADAFVKLAESSERAGRFETALAQLDRADERLPGYSRTRTARARILEAIQARDTAPQAPIEETRTPDYRERADLMAGSISRTLTGSESISVDVIQSELRQLRNLSPTDYERRVASIVSESVAHLDTIRDSDLEKARGRLDALQTLFPEDRTLSSYSLPQPRVSTGGTTRVPQGDACGNPAFAGLGQSNRAICRDELGQDKKGPRMVVVPAGGPSNERYAITKYEITVSDYNTYCALSGNCSARQNVDAALPLTNISIDEARRYAAWLSETTGFEYRLPSIAEWRYAAEAPGTPPPPKNFNCQLRGDSGLIKGLRLEDVRTGEMNGWGLQNQVGNAREWAQEGGGVSALGGSFEDSYESCEITLRVPHSGQPDAVTGFRLVRKIDGES